MPGEAFIPPPSIQSGIQPIKTQHSAISNQSEHNDALGLSYLIRAYQSRGHEAAKLDPLELQERPQVPELSIEMYGFTKSDLNRTITIPRNLYVISIYKGITYC